MDKDRDSKGPTGISLEDFKSILRKASEARERHRKLHSELLTGPIEPRILRMKMVAGGFPIGYVGWNWNTCVANPDVINLAMSYYQDHHSVILCGGNGSGKTGLAVSAGAQAISDNKTASFYSLPLLLLDLNDCYKKDNSNNRGDLVRRISGSNSSSFAVIDDLGSEEKETDSIKSDVFLIIDGRESNGKQTWITTNLDLQSLMDRYKARTFSRFKKFKILDVTGSDNRLADD